VWQLKEIIKGRCKGICPPCSGKEGVKHILLDCVENRNCRRKFLNKKIFK
jgi:hypothetical protein